MALLLIDGFEQYTIADEETMSRGGWQSTVGLDNVAIIIQAGTRHTTPAGHQLQLTGTGVVVEHGLPATSDFIVGFAFNVAAFTAQPLIVFITGISIQMQVNLTSGGEVQMRRGASTILGTSVGLGLTADSWHYIEVEIFINQTTGNYDVHVDGLSVLSDTNEDTQTVVGDDTIDLIRLPGHATLDTIFDDLYILDKIGSDNTDFLGDCRVETVFPDADGNENDFTRFGGGSNNFEAVDDGATADDDTTYNHSATATDRELYGFAALTGDIDTIFGVQARMLVRKEEAGFRAVRVIARNNVTEVESADQSLGLNWSYKNEVFENNPDGGGNWTETTVNTAQFGLDLQT